MFYLATINVDLIANGMMLILGSASLLASCQLVSRRAFAVSRSPSAGRASVRGVQRR